MNAPVVAVGIGNTTIKVGITPGTSSPDLPIWSASAEFPTTGFDPRALESMLGEGTRQWFVASVQRSAQRSLCEWVGRERPEDSYRLLSHRDMPIELDVESPEKVGLDRVAAAVAANQLREPGRPAVVVDAGTAITVNLVSADGIFRGGVILPGFKLTAQALADGTDMLPLIAADIGAEPPPAIGRSTEAAIRAGLFWGNVGAVRELVRRVALDQPHPPQLFVTGGDAQRLAGHIAPDARFVPDLVLIGIVISQSAKRTALCLSPRT